MKKKFDEYYKLDDAIIAEHWKKDNFCFDANVLLNLYRYTPKTRDAFFNLLEKIKDRIWIPYQAAFEYQKNRLVVINAQIKAYSVIRETLIAKKKEIETKLNSFNRHPYLQTSDLKKQIDSAFESISKDLDSLEREHPDYLENDPIWDRLTIILDGKIGDDFSKEDLEKTYREGKKRYDEKVPPGYMDAKEKQNEGNRSLYGDIIVWKQTLERAKTIEESIIFITDDLKEDWWYKFKGKTISPRPELVKEFRMETSKRVNIYQADRFLELANKTLSQHTDQAAIQEVRAVRLADENDIEQLAKEAALKALEMFKKKKEKSSFEKAIEQTITKNNDNNK